MGDKGSGVSPSSAPVCLRAMRPSGLMSASGTHRFLLLPSTPDAPRLPAPLGAPGLHCPRVGYNLSRIPVCLRRRKTWAMSQSESPKRWQSGRGVVTALPAMSRAPRRDLVRGDSGWLLQATAKDLKQLLRSPELHSPGKGLCGQWPPNTGMAVYIPL